jgi:hypothetical protein
MDFYITSCHTKSTKKVEDCIHMTKNYHLFKVVENRMDLYTAVMSATIGICYFSFSIHTKPPMKFKIWEQKLKERLDIWYLARQDEELQMVSTYNHVLHNFI